VGTLVVALELELEPALLPGSPPSILCARVRAGEIVVVKNDTRSIMLIERFEIIDAITVHPEMALPPENISGSKGN
jgi:hypothetical protein